MALRFRPRTTVHHAPLPQRWVVPPQLRGLACQACGFFFQDGERHGEVDLATGEVTCQTKTVRLFRSRADCHPGAGL